MKLRLDLGRVKLVMFQLAPQEADELHEHEVSYQVSIPWGSRAIMRHGEGEREVESHKRLVVSPGVLHQHQATAEGSRILLVTLEQEFLTRVASSGAERDLESIEFAPWGDAGAERLQKMLENVLQSSLLAPLPALEMQEFEWQFAQTLLSSQAGSHSRYWTPDVQLTDHPALNLVLQVIHDQLHVELSLDLLSQVSKISKFHLVRLFNEHVGQTPSQYIREQRLRRAEKLLRNTRRDVTEIAYEVGFGSLGAFERSFKKKFVVTAAEFRKRV